MACAADDVLIVGGRRRGGDGLDRTKHSVCGMMLFRCYNFISVIMIADTEKIHLWKIRNLFVGRLRADGIRTRLAANDVVARRPKGR